MAGNWRGIGRRGSAWLWLALLVSTFAGDSRRPVAAAEPRTTDSQTREFRVSVDGKERGKCTMRIDRREDGADQLRVDSQLRFNYAVYQFRYSSSSVEVWNDGRLIELDCSSDYNGARYAVKALSETKGLRVSVNGRFARADADTWVTSYWHIPERLARLAEGTDEGVIRADGTDQFAKPKPQIIPLLDTDQGRILRGELLYVGEDPVVVAGKRQPARHYRVTGDVRADLWYDSSLRLVRQESVDQGHATTLELVRIAEPAEDAEKDRAPKGPRRRPN